MTKGWGGKMSNKTVEQSGHFLFLTKQGDGDIQPEYL